MEYLLNFSIKGYFNVNRIIPGTVHLFRVFYLVTLESLLLVFIAHTLGDKNFWLRETQRFCLKTCSVHLNWMLRWNRIIRWCRRVLQFSGQIPNLVSYEHHVNSNNLLKVKENSKQKVWKMAKAGNDAYSSEVIRQGRCDHTAIIRCCSYVIPIKSILS